MATLQVTLTNEMATLQVTLTNEMAMLQATLTNEMATLQATLTGRQAACLLAQEHRQPRNQDGQHSTARAGTKASVQTHVLIKTCKPRCRSESTKCEACEAEGSIAQTSFIFPQASAAPCCL
jgi:hypothetical protein